MLRTVAKLSDVDTHTVIGAALDLTQRKVSLLTDPVQMEDWLEDLVDSRDRVEFSDLKAAMGKQGLTKEDDLSLLLGNPSQNSLFRVVYRTFHNTMFDAYNLVYFLTLFFALKHLNQVY